MPTCRERTMSQHAILHTDRDYRRLAELLDERLRFESLLTRLSTTFINLPAEEVDGQIERGLQQIVEFLGVERSSVGQFSSDGRELIVTHSYSSAGIPHVARVNLAPLWPWYTAKLRAGEVLHFSRLPEDLPAEAVNEREYVLRQGYPRSHLLVPFKVGEAVIGGLGLGSSLEIDWAPGLVQALQLVGQIIANALARKRADLVLRESEQRFRLLADAAPVLVWMSGTDKLCTYFNKPWLDFTGRPMEHELGTGWSAGVHADDRQRCLETYDQAFDARRPFRMEYRLRRADGEYRWVLDTGVPRFESDGTFEGFIGSCFDVTEEKRAEEASRHLRDQLAHAGRVTVMGELTASIAHEVNQPLCAIVTNAQAVQRMLDAGGCDLDEVREAMRDIIADGQRASAVVARIRGFVQKTPPQFVPLRINELLQEVATLMRSEMVRRGVAVKLDLADKLPAVRGDRIQLQQVILNLMVNGADAIAHLDRGKRKLILRSAPDPTGGVKVAVQDTGLGLNSATADQLFDAFFTTKPGSMGMGLAICKSIVEAHRGQISAGPGDDHGTVFQFTLPALEKGAP
jgi:PAS domain S-box-containing protein